MKARSVKEVSHLIFNCQENLKFVALRWWNSMYVVLKVTLSVNERRTHFVLFYVQLQLILRHIMSTCCVY